MDDNKTVWCGNLSDHVTEELLYELFLQAAPLERVKIPCDKEGRKANYGFITFKHEQSVDYAMQLLQSTKLFDRHINIQCRNRSSNDSGPAMNIPRNDLRNQIQTQHYNSDSRNSPNSPNNSRQRYMNNKQYSEQNNHYRHKPYERNNYHDNRGDNSRRYDDRRHTNRRNRWN